MPSSHLFDRLCRGYLLLAVLGCSLVAACDTGQVSLSLRDGDSTAGAIIEPVPETSALPTVRLEIKPADLEHMQRALTAGDPALDTAAGGTKPFVPTTYTDEHGVVSVGKVRYRGLGRWHHDPAKPSLRVRLIKATHKGGPRKFELQRPEGALAMRNWLPDRLARDLGLMTMQLEHVRLFINGEYRGVYVRNLKPTRSSILANGRMPGTVFKGDTWSKPLWTSAEAWKQRGESAEATTLFAGMLSALAMPVTADRLERLQARLEMSLYTRWTALLIITGSVHADHFHNHLFHVAPERGAIEVIPWDINGYGIHTTPDLPLDVLSHPLAAVLSRDPRWLHERNALVYRLLGGPLSAARQREIMRTELARMLPDLRADAHISSLERRAGGLDNGFGLVRWTPQDLPRKQAELEAWMDARSAHLLSELGDARVAVRPHPTSPGKSQVAVFGVVAVNAASGGDSRLLFPGLSGDVVVKEMRPYESVFRVRAPRPAPLEYDVDAAPADLTFTNAVTGAPVTPGAWPPAPRVPQRTIHPRELVRSIKTGRVVLGPGDVNVTESLSVEASQELVVRPGTRLLLGAGVSIFSRGKVLMEGTRAAPIRIVAATKGAPWGTFGVSGKKTAGSRFSHIHVEGGGAGTDGIVFFKGMFNVYGSVDLLIEHAHFGPNASGDDAVNIASTTLTIRDSRWTGSLSDALDVDEGQGVIERCRFENSGNDGIDVSKSSIVLRDVVMRGSKDKGLSVGEATALVGERLDIRNNVIGVEVKDDSRVFIVESTLEGNGVNWHGYRKKSYFTSPGHGLLAESTMQKPTKTNVDVEANGGLSLFKTPIEGEHANITALASIPDEWLRWKRTVGVNAP